VEVIERANRFAALGDPIRLRIVDALAITDRSPGELVAEIGAPTNLLAHHLDVLERAGMIERLPSSGDRRRRYIKLQHEALWSLRIGAGLPAAPVLFVCTHNSARSQIAAALWKTRVGTPAYSAGTHPAERVHPGAVAAGKRAGLDLSKSSPRHISDVDTDAMTIITVCDQAHEELPTRTVHHHWSTPDPVITPTRKAFDAALRQIGDRIDALRNEENE
jgi:protein-tyrosine-phosphatase/DNA-binding transcriptional ArsR family regulator